MEAQHQKIQCAVYFTKIKIFNRHNNLSFKINIRGVNLRRCELSKRTAGQTVNLASKDFKVNRMFVLLINCSQLAKMKKYFSYMSLS